MARSEVYKVGFSEKNVYDAAREWEKNPSASRYGKSKTYDVLIGGKRYPPMPIIEIANAKAGNGPMSNYFGGAIKGRGHRALREAGFSVVRKNQPTDPEKDLEQDIAEIISSSKGTERTQLIQARIGQGKFRADLLEFWGAKCAVLGIDCVEILRASHIRRWADCKGKYAHLRLSSENGLLLSANLDLLFENGLISFSDNGTLLKSSYLKPSVAKQVGLDRPAKLRIKPSEVQASHLAQHRRDFSYPD